MSIENGLSKKPEAVLEKDHISPKTQEAANDNEQDAYEERVQEQTATFEEEEETLKKQDLKKASGVLERLKNRFGGKNKEPQAEHSTEVSQINNEEGTESDPGSEFQQGDEFFEAGKFYKVLNFTSPRIDNEPENLTLEQAKFVMDARDKQMEKAGQSERNTDATYGSNYAKDLLVGTPNERAEAKKPDLGRSFVAIDENGGQITRYEREVEKLNPVSKTKIEEMMDAIPPNLRPNGGSISPVDTMTKKIQK